MTVKLVPMLDERTPDGGYLVYDTEGFPVGSVKEGHTSDVDPLWTAYEVRGRRIGSGETFAAALAALWRFLRDYQTQPVYGLRQMLLVVPEGAGYVVQVNGIRAGYLRYVDEVWVVYDADKAYAGAVQTMEQGAVMLRKGVK